MKSHGPWKIKKTNDIYLDPFLHVWVDNVVRPDGRDGTHVVAKMKPGVCVIALDEKRNVYLTSEFHYGVGRYSIEAVSGGIEPGEDPALTARRELQEEIGLDAARWERLTSVDPFTTIVVSPVELYLATELSDVLSNPDGTEQIEKVVMPLNEAVQQVVGGAITHAPTCTAILLVDRIVNQS